MKLSVERIKNIDWKEFGVNHGEKIALGFVGLMVVMILGMGTRWKTFQEKQPKELVDKVDEESKLLAAATWPEEEQAAFTAEYRPEKEKFIPQYDVNDVYDNTYSIVKADAFQYPPGHPMIWPLHRQQEPIEEPTWYPVEDLIATADRFIMELPPEGQEAITDGAVTLDETEDANSKPKSRAEALLDRFKKQPMSNRPMDGSDGFDPAQYMRGSDPMDGGCPDDANNPYANYGADYMGMDGAGGTGVAMNVRGVRYVAVRGKYPFRKQLDAIMKARHDTRPLDPWSLVNIVNFEIQRQKALPGPNPWSDDEKDWVTLDKSIAYDLLAETLDYAEEIVDYSNTYYTITSPLPMRLASSWTPYFVGHPDIKTMSEREIEMRRLINEQLVRMEKDLKNSTDAGLGGFANVQRNANGMLNQVTSDTGSYRQMMGNLQRSMDPDGEGDFQMPQELNMMLSQAPQVPQYVLFRYLDFDVEPGKAYRYRVRLKLTNPNRYELPDRLAAANVGVGDFRETPWSEPSTDHNNELTVMSEDSQFFVGEVVVPRGPNEPYAKIDLYQWLSKVGTTANKMIDVKVGQLVGQPAPDVEEEELNDPQTLTKLKDELVEVLRPFESFKHEAVDLATDVAVVDLIGPTPRNPRDFHDALGVRRADQVNPLSQVLVVNEFGELENRNPIAQLSKHQEAEALLTAEHSEWEYLKQAAQQQIPGDGADQSYEDAINGLMEFGSSPMGAGRGGAAQSGRGGGRGGAMQSGRGGGRGGGANPLRRNRRGGNVES